MRNRMPHRYFAGFVFLLAFTLLSSCTTEHNGSEPSISDDPIYIEVNTNSVIGSTINNVEITDMRMIIADQSSDLIFQNISTASLHENPSQNGFIVNVRPGSYRIYLIANETSNMTPELNAAKSLKDVREYVVSSLDYDSYTESNLTLFAENTIKVKENPANTSQGLVSIDNGSTWKSYYTANLTRIMAKVTLNLKKANITDVIKIMEVWVMHMPKDFYLGNIPYPETELEYENMQAVTFPEHRTLTSSTEPEPPIFADFFIRESRFLPVTNRDEATYLLIAATFNGAVNLYTVPLGKPEGGNPSAPISDYNIYKGNHYIVNGIISKRGSFDNEFTVTVLPWNKITGDLEFNKPVEFSGSWAGGTNISSGMVYVYYNQYAEYQFELKKPAGAIWTASLTNGAQFEFETDSAVSQGITAPGYIYKIRIKPRVLQTVPGVKTDFYITVGGEEIDLNGAASGTRYTINQIPQ